MNDIEINDKLHGFAIAEAAGIQFNPRVDISIARVTPEGNIRGGVVFNSYTGLGGSISMHVASFQPLWISKALLWVCFDYPFNQLGVEKIFGQVPASNEQAIAFDLNLGFEIEHRIKDVYPDGDMVLLSMTRAACRFLNIRVGGSTGRKSKSATAS